MQHSTMSKLGMLDGLWEMEGDQDDSTQKA